MPLYEYTCEKCGNTFAILRPVKKRRDKALCQKCGTHNGCLSISNIARTPGKWGESNSANSWAT